MSNIANFCDGNFTDTKPDMTVSSGFYIGLGIFGNLVAVILLVKQSTFHKWKVFYRLVLTLVCADLVGIVIFGVIGVIESSQTGLNWKDEGPLCETESVLIAFISLTNILIVTVIAIERFLALWHPYSYSSIKGHPIILLSPLIILISTVVMATLSLTVGHSEKIYPCNFCFINIYSTDFMDYIFAFIYVIIGLILATVSVVMNILVAIALSRGQRGYSRQRESRIYISYERRDHCGMLLQIGLVFSIIAVCWIPVMIKMLITMVVSNTSEEDMKDNFLFFRLASWALVVDPWVYVLLRREIILNVCLFFKREERPHMTSSGDIAERKSLAPVPDHDHNRSSYGTI